MNEDNNDNDDDDDDDDDDTDSDDDYDSDNDDEITVKEMNNNFKKIDEPKSFEDQIDILKKYHVEMNTGIRVIMKIIKRQILDYIN